MFSYTFFVLKDKNGHFTWNLFLYIMHMEVLILVEKPFYDARYDAVFKNAVARDEEVFKYFLKYALEREIKSYKIIPNELPKKEFSIKSKTLDINVKTDIGNIIVEINNGFYTSLPIRNLAYLSSVFSNSVSRGDSYDNVPLHILLNITWGERNKRGNINRILCTIRERNKVL